jgi:structural maintenance of chromosome 4
MTMIDASGGVAPPTEQAVVVGANGKKLNRRLMIERVCLENFKSYYGKKEIGPLHKCFTAVVGPNGSGKSNLIECLLFVFGKRAKRMRLNKLSELIHNSA